MPLAASRKRILTFLLSLGLLSVPLVAQSGRPTAVASTKPETVEWVYRIHYGSEDEWFQIFRKYQLAILERQKQLGYVMDYSLWAPGLHTSEDSRWDYRVVITRSTHEPPAGQSEEELSRQLFPDQAAFKRDENRRWELTTNHWDLPIHQVDPNRQQ